VTSEATFTEVFRREAVRITASLTRRFRDFDVAEDATQDALLAALESWPQGGLPSEPGAWLMTVATRRALNRLKREANYRQKLEALSLEPAVRGTDDRLRLIVMCCHPALSREAQVGLTLRAVCGFTTAQVARAFLAEEDTVAQRLVRAKRRISQAGIPFCLPSPSEVGDRLHEILSVLYLLFNEAYLSRTAGTPFQRDLAEEALWLASLLGRLWPNQPEILGLQALMTLHLARGDTRFTAAGEIVLLSDQERSRWDASAIRHAVALLHQAAALGHVGPYQLEAAIAACHAEARTYAETDWQQIVALYDMLLVLTPTPVVRLNRAIAVAMLAGPQPALDELDRVSSELSRYHIFQATLGELLARAGRQQEANVARRRALDLAGNRAEQSLLRARLFREIGPSADQPVEPPEVVLDR